MKKAISILVMVLLAALVAGPAFAQESRQAITVANADKLTQTFRLGRGTLDHVRFLPNGKTILLGGGVGVFLYDATLLNTETEPPLLDPLASVRAMDVSPDGTLLAISAYNRVALYDVNTHELVQDTGVTSGIDEVRFSPDGKILVMISSTKGVLFYDVPGKTERGSIDGRFRINGVTAFSPDGKLIVVPGGDNSFHLFNTETLEPVGVFTGHTGAAQAAAFSPDGKTLATVGRDNSFRLWNVADQKEIMMVNKTADGKNLEAPYGLVYSPDGKTIATGHGMGIVRLWNAVSGEIIKEVQKGQFPILDLAYSLDGKTIAAVLEPIGAALWDSTLDQELAEVVGHIDQVFSVGFSGDSTTLALATRDWTLYMWDVTGGKELNFSPSFPDSTNSIVGNRKVFTYSPDGSVIAVVDRMMGIAPTLRDPHSGSVLQTLETNKLHANTLAFSPDSTLIALGFSTGEVGLYEVKSGKQLVLVATANDDIVDLAWSPDQTMLAAACHEGAVRIYGVK